MKKTLSAIFGIDSRSLGFARILLGYILVIDALNKLIYAQEFFTDDGIVPRVPYVRDYLGDWVFSFHLASGELWFQVLLISLGLLSSFLFMIGYRWRISAIVSFVLLCSMQNRNVAILTGADDVIRLFLFWFMFLPSPGAFALDQVETKPRLISGIAPAALLIQLLLIYVFTTLWKLDPVYTTEYSAVYYSLNLDYYAKPLGVLLRQNLGLTKILTVATMVLEGLGPLLALIPLWTVRLGVTFAFIIFHIGLFATLSLGMFSGIMIAYWTLFLPGKVWEFLPLAKIEWALNGILNWVGKWLKPAVQEESWPRIPASVRYRVIELLALTSLCLVVAVNAFGLTEDSKSTFADPLDHFAYSANIDQKWQMFAPSPVRSDGWFVIKGEYQDGTEVDFITGLTPTEKKPEHISELYRSKQWQTYMTRLWEDTNNVLVEPYARYLCRLHGKEDVKARSALERIEIYFFEELTPPLGEAFAPIKRHHIWTQDCNY